MPNPIKIVKAVKKATTKKTATKTKQPIPTKIKTTSKTYDVKKTITGKVKLKDIKTKKTITIPKNQSLTSENIREAKFKKTQKQINRKQNAIIYGGGTAIGAAIGIPLGNAIVKRRGK